MRALVEDWALPSGVRGQSRERHWRAWPRDGRGDFGGFFRCGAFFNFGLGCGDDTEFVADARFTSELFGFTFLGAANGAGSHDEAE